MKPNRVLGKGLSALIPDAELGSRLGDREVRLLPLTAIGLNPHQPRKLFNDKELQELADSVGQVGVLQPVLVRRLRAAEPLALLTVDAVMARARGGSAAAPVATSAAAPDAAPAAPTHCLVAGERRVRAAWLAGVREVPAIVCTYEEAEALKIALLENLHRADLNPMEEAAAYRRLLEAYGATQDELAGMLAKNRSTVANTLRLLGLADEIQEMVRAGELSRGHAKALLALDDPALRLRLARLCRTRGLSVRECEQRAQRLASRRPETESGRRRRARGGETREVQALRGRAEETLGAPVAIDRDARTGRGTITVRFFSNDDLERILGLMGVNTDLG